MIERLIATLEQKFPDLTPAEIADILWLTLQQWQSQQVLPTRPAAPVLQQSSEASRESTQPLSPPPPRQASQTSQSTSLSPTTIVGVTTQHPTAPRQSPSSLPPGTALSIPDARSLRRSLDLLKALRPLIRQVPAGDAKTLDISATVRAIADTNLWQVKLRPVLESWLELAIVVDTSTSMVIWQRTILELRRTLSQSGVFRDVRFWSLSAVNQDSQWQISLHPGFGPAIVQPASCRPQELLDPRGRRLILVVSDCIAPYWDSQPMRDVLQLWGDRGPMALLQVLPEWLWNRTALLEVKLGQVVNSSPGQVNRSLTFVRRERWNRKPATGVKVPVITLDPNVVARWSQMVAGNASVAAPGLLFSPAQVRQLAENTRVAELSAIERLEQFRNFSSPIARRLAGLLAACPEVNLPIIRMIQAAMLPQSQQVHVAEVLLGGLFKPLTERTAQTPADKVQYVFHEGVQQLVQHTVSSEQSFEALSRWIQERFGYSLVDFQAFLTAERITQVKPFAGVFLDVLKLRGDQHSEIIRQLEAELQPHYNSASQLTQQETANQDFEIRTRQGASPEIVIAIHGGHLQPGTTELADAVAGNRHSFYSFVSLRPEIDQSLYVASTQFDEAIAQQMVQRSQSVLSIHGCRGNTAYIRVGGLDEERRQSIADALLQADFVVASDLDRGLHPNNICNLGLTGRGVQIEVSRGLRNQFGNTEVFQRLVSALQRGFEINSQAARSEQCKIYISYARQDSKFLEMLLQGLEPLSRQGEISVWCDLYVQTYVDQVAEIEQHFNAADLILMLVSADYLASDYCYDREVTRAIDRHRAGAAKIIPILVRPCSWQNAAFGNLPVLPENAQPIAGWEDSDAALLEVRQGIRQAIQSRLTGPIAYEPPPLLWAERDVKVFFSYSHRDEVLRDELEKHLSTLKRTGLILTWHDRKIQAGTEWAREIQQQLYSADVILLLVTPDYLASPYCYEHDLPSAIEQYQSGAAIVIPILLRPCAWQNARFGNLPLLPVNAQPVTTWESQDDAMVEIVQGIQQAIQARTREPVAYTPPIPPSVSRPLEVFFSYSHRDEAIREEIARHLSILNRLGLVSELRDRVSADEEWDEAVTSQLNSADIILILVSSDYLASPYCYELELPRAISRYQSGNAILIPVLLRPCDWQYALFGNLPLLPSSEPLTAWSNRDEALLTIIQGIQDAILNRSTRPISYKSPVSPIANRGIEVFFSYAHQDEDLRDQLSTHLALLERQGVISVWHDRMISTSDWANLIDSHLDSANLILLLVSPDYLASDYCYGIEMQRAIERHQAVEAIVIPIILRPCAWQSAPFARLQALPENAKPVTSWTDQDEAMLNVAQGILRAIQMGYSESLNDALLQSPLANRNIPVFLSCAPANEPVCEELSRHLSMLERQGAISIWYEGKLTADDLSSQQQKDIDSQFNLAQVILLLVSADYLASSIYDRDQSKLINRCRSGAARVIPLILSPCDWRMTWFGNVPPLPPEAQPMSTWADRDTAMLSVVQELQAALQGAPPTSESYTAPLSPLADRQIQVFVSYAAEDTGLQEKLVNHLSILERQRAISIWHGGMLPAEWEPERKREEIDRQLHLAEVSLILISPRYLVSEYCYDYELTQIMQRYEARAVMVIPILLTPCYLEYTPLENIQFLPRFGKPVTSWSNQDEAFLSIVEEIRSSLIAFFLTNDSSHLRDSVEIESEPAIDAEAFCRSLSEQYARSELRHFEQSVSNALESYLEGLVLNPEPASAYTYEAEIDGISLSEFKFNVIKEPSLFFSPVNVDPDAIVVEANLNALVSLECSFYFTTYDSIDHEDFPIGTNSTTIETNLAIAVSISLTGGFVDPDSELEVGDIDFDITNLNQIDWGFIDLDWEDSEDEIDEGEIQGDDKFSNGDPEPNRNTDNGEVGLTDELKVDEDFPF